MFLDFYLVLIPMTTFRLCLFILGNRSETSRSSSLSCLKSKFAEGFEGSNFLDQFIQVFIF